MAGFGARAGYKEDDVRERQAQGRTAIDAVRAVPSEARQCRSGDPCAGTIGLASPGPMQLMTLAPAAWVDNAEVCILQTSRRRWSGDVAGQASDNPPNANDRCVAQIANSNTKEARNIRSIVVKDYRKIEIEFHINCVI